jgi:hypothetical protein
MFLAKHLPTEQKAQPIAQVLAAQIFSSENPERGGKMSIANWCISPESDARKVRYGATVFYSTVVCLTGNRIPNSGQVFLHAQMLADPPTRGSPKRLHWHRLGTTVRSLKRFEEVNRQ